MNLSTKQNIIEVALELFANNGYGQTSIREIAKTADVNLAAINYHFKSKEGLYSEIMKYSFYKFEDEISKIDKNLSFDEYVVQYFRFFKENSNILRNVFKIFIIDTVEDADYSEVHKNQKVLGPPGADHLAEVLLKNLTYVPPLSEIQFLVDILATQVLHKALVLCSGKIEKMKNQIKDPEVLALFSDNYQEDNIRRISHLLLRELASKKS